MTPFGWFLYAAGPPYHGEPPDLVAVMRLWIRSDEYGEPEQVIAFVLACAEAFELTGRWGFAWALTCSKPHLDGFGGGAQVIDLVARKSVGWNDCEHWLLGALDPVSDAETGIAQSAAIGGEQVVGTGAHSTED